MGLTAMKNYTVLIQKIQQAFPEKNPQNSRSKVFSETMSATTTVIII